MKYRIVYRRTLEQNATLDIDAPDIAVAGQIALNYVTRDLTWEDEVDMNTHPVLVEESN